MQPVHVIILVGLLSMILCGAFPYASETSFDNDVATILVKSNFARRDDYDPYGFNSILSRFHKRSKLSHIVKRNSGFPYRMHFI